MAASGQVKRPNALEVFESKKTICSGYAILYKLLLNEFDIECEVVDGYAKSKEGLLELDSSEIAHAWNVIKLNGTWSLVDVTWANTTRVEGRVSSFYYKMPPEFFIYNHFPLIAQWQLMEEPISLKEFQSLPEVNEEYYALGFAEVSPQVYLKEGQFRLVIGKSKDWKPIISKSLTGQHYEALKFKRKNKGEYQELTFSVDDSERFILRLDAYKYIDWPQQVTQTELAYLVIPQNTSIFHK